ncbi:MAG: M23 family metallopeptidase [Actinomycetia bacterium]|nr:M23 family metallopeptidase [Actinomycetes bacterium]
MTLDRQRRPEISGATGLLTPSRWTWEPFAIPVLLLASIITPHIVLPALLAVPASLIFVMSVGRWASWRQRPRQDQGHPLTTSSPVGPGWTVVRGPLPGLRPHTTHLLAQTYAMDLLPAERLSATRSTHRHNRLVGLPSPDRFAAFGSPLHAPAAGQVTSAVDVLRDHRAYASLLGLLLWSIQQFVPRSFLGARGILGNHLIINTEDRYLLLAHLQRGSCEVAAGDWVTEGQLVARCGNSGNSTEPHLHIQAMNGPNIWKAHGLPLHFTPPSALPSE